MPSFHCLFFCFLLLCWPFIHRGQAVTTPPSPDTLPVVRRTTAPDKVFIIHTITISGNKKTKAGTITRELPFRPGDSVYLPELVASFRRARELLFNTRLFNNVVVSLKNFNGMLVDVQVDVTERWYIFPVPYFRPVDRNLSAWADKNYSLSRVNYGIKFLHSNFTGRNDRLRIWLLTGYARQFQLNYDQPAADKSMQHGFGFGVLYSALREVNSSTFDNRQVFINPENVSPSGHYLLRQSTATLNYFYRPALTTRHVFRLGASYLQPDSIVYAVNPTFLSTTSARVCYPEFSYSLEYQHVDYVSYVLTGFMGDLNFTRKGLGSNMDLSQFTGRFTTGTPLGQGFNLGFQGYGTLRLPLEQPFYNQRLLGYGDTYLRGLEPYVVDGVAGGLLRTTFRKQLLRFNINGSRIPTLQTIPFSLYAKVYGDAGYVYNRSNRDNSLVNTLLYTAGAGLDLVSAYDFVFRAELSINQLGRTGIFFHLRNDF